VIVERRKLERIKKVVGGEQSGWKAVESHLNTGCGKLQ